MATHSPSRQGGHTIEVAAPPDAVHELIADIANWPRTFPATIHVDRFFATSARRSSRSTSSSSS